VWHRRNKHINERGPRQQNLMILGQTKVVTKIINMNTSSNDNSFKQTIVHMMYNRCIYSIIYFLSFICSSIFSTIKHPLAMGLILLIQTIFICLLRGLLIKSFWFSYILFLIFIGGILVLFIYVTSLASNEIFSFSIKKFYLKLLYPILIYSYNDIFR